MNKILGVLMLLLMVGTVSATVRLDKSSLSFNSNYGSNCGEVYAEICNVGDEDMAGTSTYDVYYAESGNPKSGSVVDSGSIPALKADECTTLTYAADADGNYMFMANQRPGHPGTGIAWSEGIEYTDCTVPEFGVVAGSLALVGALGIFLYRRK